MEAGIDFEPAVAIEHLKPRDQRVSKRDFQDGSIGEEGGGLVQSTVMSKVGT